MRLEVRMVVTGELMTGRSYKDDTEDLWGTGNVSRSGCHLHASVEYIPRRGIGTLGSCVLIFN